MRTSFIKYALTGAIVLCAIYGGLAQDAVVPETSGHRLAVLWTSADPDVAEKVCFTYIQNAKKQGWFDQIVLVVWGPSVKLLAENDDLKVFVKKMMEMGITVEASISCANRYGAEADLEDLDIDVKAMGVPLTGYIREGWHVLTF